MYFKQIDMQGFKSFADRTSLQLEQGMTAVVGPNGCGKSNILDATRWALGEQSAKALRGAHMQDVVFNGSEDRAPMGMAEVTLTFDNTDGKLPIDFSEVQVTRRVYRSGESEYLINKAQCRLRDIQELFMDTGIGTNAYSMIGQGKISMVLSSKPDDRRFLFEEAAGIIKYKARKRVAMRKLDQAEQNQLRLGDIIAEVERQMRSLKRQVNAAIRHRELTDQLKDLEVRASFLKYRELSAQIEKLRAQYDESQKGYESENTRLGELETKHEESSLRKLEVDRTLHARREGVHELDGELVKIDRQVALIRQQITFSIEQREKALQERQVLEQRSAAIEQSLTEVGERRSGLDDEEQSIREAIQAKQADYESASSAVKAAEEKLEAARAHAVERVGMRAEAQTAIETLGVGIQSVDEQLELIYDRQSEAGTRQEELIRILDDARGNENSQAEELRGLESKRVELQGEVERLDRELENLQQHRQNLEVTQSSVTARLNSFRELRDSYEGFAAGVKAVMQAKQDGSLVGTGVFGPVGDLLSTQTEHEKAVEAALGGGINNIVVEKAEQARAAIDYLKQEKAGRVTFLPLDTVQPGNRNRAHSITGVAGVVGPMTDFIEYDPAIENAVAFLLNDTVLVDSLETALSIARERSQYPRMVTPDGEVVARGGTVTGGRTRHEHRGLLGRSAEIEEMEARCEALVAEIATAGENIDAQSTRREERRAGLGELEEQVATRLKAQQETRHLVAQSENELGTLQKSLSAFDDERDAQKRKREGLESNRLEKLEQAQSMETEEEAAQRAIAEAQDETAHARAAESLRNSELSDQRVALANVTQSLEEIDRDRNRLEEEKTETQAETDNRAHAVEEFEQNRIAMENDTRGLEEQATAMGESREEAQEKVAEAEAQRQELLDESDALDTELKTLRDQVRESQSRVHKIEMELRHDEDQLGFFEERIQEEYGIALSSLEEDKVGEDELDDETRDNMVKEIRQKLERMGAVNLMAIEEYEALTERHGFLVEQDADLREAREQLLSVVHRIDETITEMFVSTFKAVAENFHGYFRRLFNGGQARIYLLDEENPLESGIEIEAKPPGKKPQTLSLLSGGEQAMTAIALLFSIFKAKPSPFCVLDEVDAPLDDANIGRFVEMVEEFAVDTQFVVITHNKQTMAKAEALYGVTQQEQGVSQLVSVRLGQDKISAA